ncbi:MAG: tRNA preQ1(34) S-adenosylmethionine ribosyltransferase-isomerase QueA [Prevotellaceae bacterium]|jgi:S-adenosylmethionine:tRNA ribosyltransferase-isomerase|nr:tRNA preQ1(34) S-adenosylmethionine ribosyltransferase-isomerase QueA [Prevotellaceae bacterium]
MKDKKQIVPEISVRDYTYILPEEKIARYPNSERDSSRLLVYDRGISEHVFSHLPEIIPSGSMLVFNNSKVIRARIFFRKETGAMIEIFCLHPDSPSVFDEALSSVHRCSWWCAVGNAKRWKNEILEKEFEYEGGKYFLKAKKINAGDDFLIMFEWDAPADFSQTLDCCGNIPVPPYLKRDAEQIDEYSYQTVYSKLKGSVAAPTAGLHFTRNVLTALENKGIDFEEITLHVGAGTFKPIKEKSVHKHAMHKETFIVNRSTLEHLCSKTGDIIAVGTTSARMLESLYWLGVTADSKNGYSLSQWEAYQYSTDISAKEAFARLIDKMDSQKTVSEQASTEIMIVPGYKFRTVKGLITNFHQPESTLILLVAAFVGDKWREIYSYALNSGFRFLSYGDCSLLFNNE